MLSDNQLTHHQGRLMVITIIALAMTTGAGIFAGYVCLTADWEVVDRPPKVFNVMGAVTGFLIYGISFAATMLFPRTPDTIRPPTSRDNSTSTAVEDSAIQGIIKLITTEYAVRYALMEGAIFLNIMVLMLEARWLTVVTVCVGFALMVLRFPFKFRTTAQLCQRFEEWQRTSLS